MAFRRSKLEKMRKKVDDKFQKTLDDKLSSSFLGIEGWSRYIRASARCRAWRKAWEILRRCSPT